MCQRKRRKLASLVFNIKYSSEIKQMPPFSSPGKYMVPWSFMAEMSLCLCDFFILLTNFLMDMQNYSEN